MIIERLSEMLPSSFAPGFFASRSWPVFLSLMPMLLSLLAGCDSKGNDGPTSVHESLVQLQESAKQLEDGSEISQSVRAAAGSDENENHEPTGTFKVKFETTAGDFVIEVHRDWSPIGAERFHRLVEAGFYDDCRFFRVLPNFMVQFGVNGDPAIHQEWQKNLLDDPRKEHNEKGYVTFATSGRNTRTTQVFINYRDNANFLDGQGFTPFGKVVEGMDVVEQIAAQPTDGISKAEAVKGQILTAPVAIKKAYRN